jgi:hypothetical protein
VKRLVALPLEERQETEIVRRLTDAGIAHRAARSPFRFLGADAIWVADEDYARARALLEGEVKEFASQARAEWNTEWRNAHRGAYLHWLWHRARHASMDDVLRALLLIALVAVLLLYPLAYIF